jgi:KDO2-lipid IV(A) lauroyltransferase
MMAEVNARIAAWVEDDPGQWFWLHRRWKLRPRGVQQRAAAQKRP